MRTFFLTALLLAFSVATAFAAADGLISKKSPYDVNTTVKRLDEVLKEKKMTLFITIDHAENGRKVGLALRPTVLVIFGNPKAGTPVMQCQQTAAIDFPQKALIWEDEEGQVWLSYNDPRYVAARHHITDCGKPLARVEKALAAIAEATVRK